MIYRRDRADVNSDGGLVRNRIDVESTVDRADVQSSLTHEFVRRIGKAESLQFLHCTRRLVDSVVALLGHRAVSRHAFGFRAQPECPLVPNERVVGGRLRYDHCTSAAQHAILLQVECSLATSFFASRDYERQT